MNKKVKLYFIILVNLLAWGYVGYKVYGALQGDDDVEFTNGPTGIKKIEDQKKEEKLTLALNYADPFLKNGNFSSNHTTVKSNSSNHTTGAVKSKQPIVATAAKTTTVVSAPPAITIKYMGLLKNNDKGTHTAMLNVNDRSVFAKQNDVIDGYTILEVTKSFIKVKKDKEVLTISK